jgi:hypothetical protein
VDKSEIPWNELFQYLLGLSVANMHEEEERKKKINELSDLFVETATSTVKKLILESYLPISERTIQPDIRFGGQAGE